MKKMTLEERMRHHYSGEKRKGESNNHLSLRNRMFYQAYGLGRLSLDDGKQKRACQKTSVVLTCKIGDTELCEGDEIKIYAIGYNPFSCLTKDINDQNKRTLVTFNTCANVKLRLDIFDSFCKREITLTVMSGILRNNDSIEVTIGGNDSLKVSEIVRPLIFYLEYKKSGEEFSKLIDRTVLDVSAAEINTIECNISPMVMCNEKSDLSIRLLDKCENPSDSNADIQWNPQKEVKVAKDFKLQEGDLGYRRLKKGVEFYASGFYILKGKDIINNISVSSNPVKCVDKKPEYSLFFGDIHNHDHLSPGLASPQEAYSAARQQGLHFLALPIQTQSGNLTEDKWLIANYMAEQFYKPGEFITFPAIEWQHYAFGHKVICFMNPDQPMISPYDLRYDTPEKLFAELRKSDAFIQVHHTGYKLDCHVPGTDWDYNDEFLQTILEISSCHGSSEKANSERPLNNPGTGYLQNTLSMGNHIGVIGGSDGHNGRPVKSVREPRMYPGGLACLYAKDLTRRGLFEAFRARRCYGTTGAKIIMEFDINGHNMGEIIKEQCKRKLRVLVAGTDIIETIEIIKNNQVIHSEHPKKDYAEILFEDQSEPELKEDFYYVKVIQKDSELAWSSPIWVNTIKKSL